MKKQLILLCTLALGLALAACGGSTSTTEPAPAEAVATNTPALQATATEGASQDLSARSQAIVEAGVVRIASYDSNVDSFFMQEGNELSGFEVDLAQEVVARLFGETISIEWIPTSFQDMLNTLVAGEADMVFHHVLVSPDRQEVVDFSSAYYLTGEVLVVPEESSISSLEDLNGQTVGNFVNPTYRQGLEGAIAEAGLEVNVVEFDDFDDAMDALQNGETRAQWFTWENLRYQPDLRYLPGPFDGRTVAIALPKGEADFKAEVNAALEAIIEEGRWLEIFESWFDDQAPWQPEDMLPAGTAAAESEEAELSGPTLPAAEAPIVFTRATEVAADTYVTNIYTVNMDGSQLTQVTDGIGSLTLPKWSADRQTIAFVLYGEEYSTINTIGVDGADLTQLSDFPSAYPDWLSSGEGVIFSTDFYTGAERIYDLYAADTESGEISKVMDAAGAGNRDLSVSHDGSQLAFISNRAGNYDVYVLDLNTPGAQPVQLTNDPEFEGYPHWSPDDSQILFSRQRTLENGEAAMNVWVMDADGSNQTPLTDSDFWDWRGVWSPDGEYIAFISARNEVRELWIMEADGSDQHAILSDGSFYEAPDW